MINDGKRQKPGKRTGMLTRLGRTGAWDAQDTRRWRGRGRARRREDRGQGWGATELPGPRWLPGAAGCALNVERDTHSDNILQNALRLPDAMWFGGIGGPGRSWGTTGPGRPLPGFQPCPGLRAVGEGGQRVALSHTGL